MKITIENKTGETKVIRLIPSVNGEAAVTLDSASVVLQDNGVVNIGLASAEPDVS